MDYRQAVPLLDDPPFGLRGIRFGIWVKPNGAPQFTGDRPASGWEAIGIWHNEKTKLQWNGGGHSAAWNFQAAE